MRITQRSKLEAFEYCDRRGYWGYLYKGRGIQHRGFDPDLLMGSAIHLGIERLLKGASEDDAAASAVIYFSQTFNELGLSSMLIETEFGFDQVAFSTTQATFMVNLVEALVRGFARVRLPKLLAEYRILDIEREEEYLIHPELKFLSRSDFISERLSDKSLFIHNLKSVKWPDGAWRKKFHYDQQTLSELLGPEERYGKKFGGVIIEGLVKGIKNIEYPRGSGVRYNNSPLLWAWAGPSNPPFPADIRVKYEYVDESGRSRRLGPSYQRVPAYTVMPLRDWIDKVQKEAPEVLESQFVTLPAVLRNDLEIEEWKLSTLHKEDDIQCAEGLVEDGGLKDLPIFFPKKTSNGNCLGYGDTTCPFFLLCWQNASPDDTSLYIPRIYNHPAEEECAKKTGE